MIEIFAAGTEKDQYIRINFVGYTGAGKTSLMFQMFLRKFIPKDIKSTNGMDILIGHCIVDILTGEWKRYNPKENG